MAGNAVLICRWFDEVWNKGREETIDAMCSKNAVGHGQGQHGADVRGPEHFKLFWRGFRAGFSNIHVDIHDTIEQGDKVVARWTIAMTHTGPFLGIAPANKRVSVNGISIQRCRRADYGSLGQLGPVKSVSPARRGAGATILIKHSSFAGFVPV